MWRGLVQLWWTGSYLQSNEGIETVCIAEALWIFTVAVFLFSAMTGHIETEEIVALPVLWLQGERNHSNCRKNGW